MTGSGEIWSRTSRLAITGALGFWVANFAISLTPLAAEYRAARSIPYLPMLVEALLAGLMIGFCVSYVLLRFYDRVPTENSISKAIVLSFIVLVVVTMVIEVPANLLTTTSDAWRYFLIGVGFNGLRFLALGVVVGYRCQRLDPRLRT